MYKRTKQAINDVQSIMKFVPMSHSYFELHQFTSTLMVRDSRVYFFRNSKSIRF